MQLTLNQQLLAVLNCKQDTHSADITLVIACAVKKREAGTGTVGVLFVSVKGQPMYVQMGCQIRPLKFESRIKTYLRGSMSKYWEYGLSAT